MRTFDFSPLYRSTVGFDRVFDLIDAAARLEDGGNAYPPYNIEVTGEDAFRVSVAVAGFAESDLNVEVRENTLTVSGKKGDDKQDNKFLHRGIAGRQFERRFQLADHVKVTSASLEHGVLNIDLAREIPEEYRPRQIAIKSSGAKVIENQADAA